MKKGLIPYGVAFVFLVLLILLAVGAMFFADDREEIFSRRKHKSSQSMEIQGRWLGMRLISLDASSARQLGVPPSVQGVMVMEIEERNGWRARLAGVQPGDVIMAVNGIEVQNLADLYDVSRDLDVGSAIMLDILRWGQHMALVLPSVYAAPPVQGSPQAGQGDQPAPMTPREGNAGAAQPAGLVSGTQDPLFYCPLHNRVWPQNAVHPHYRCPLGRCPLNRVR